MIMWEKLIRGLRDLGAEFMAMEDANDAFLAEPGHST